MSDDTNAKRERQQWDRETLNTLHGKISADPLNHPAVAESLVVIALDSLDHPECLPKDFTSLVRLKVVAERPLSQPFGEEEHADLIRHGDEEVTPDMALHHRQVFDIRSPRMKMLKGFKGNTEFEHLLPELYVRRSMDLDEIESRELPAGRESQSALPIRVQSYISLKRRHVIERSPIEASKLKNTPWLDVEAFDGGAKPVEASEVEPAAKVTGEAALIGVDDMALVFDDVHHARNSSAGNAMNNWMYPNNKTER